MLGLDPLIDDVLINDDIRDLSARCIRCGRNGSRGRGRSGARSQNRGWSWSSPFGRVIFLWLRWGRKDVGELDIQIKR